MGLDFPCGDGQQEVGRETAKSQASKRLPRPRQQGAHALGEGSQLLEVMGRRGAASISMVEDGGNLHREGLHRDPWIRREVMKSSMAQSVRHQSHRIAARYDREPAIATF